MPFGLFGRKHNESSELSSEIASLKQDVAQVLIMLTDLQKKVSIIDTSTSNPLLAQQLERLIIALSSPSYMAPSQRALEEAFHNAIEEAYDFIRDREEFHSHPPIELPLGTSGTYVLPLDPTYHYQLLFSNPLLPEESATILVIPRSYAEDHTLPILRRANGQIIQRRSLNIHVRKSPPQLIEAIRLLQKKLWPTIYLIERRLLSDGRVQSLYWNCSERVHDQDLPRFANYLCLYFSYDSEGTTVTSDIEVNSEDTRRLTTPLEKRLETSNTHPEANIEEMEA